MVFRTLVQLHAEGFERQLFIPPFGLSPVILNILMHLADPTFWCESGLPGYKDQINHSKYTRPTIVCCFVFFMSITVFQISKCNQKYLVSLSNSIKWPGPHLFFDNFQQLSTSINMNVSIFNILYRPALP